LIQPNVTSNKRRATRVNLNSSADPLSIKTLNSDRKSLVNPGQWPRLGVFGEGTLDGQVLRMATVTALTPLSVMRIPKAEIVRVIHEESTFAELFIAHLLARNSRAEEDLVDQLFNSSEKPLARTLLLLANFGKERPPEPVMARISQEMLAEMIGTTRARVNALMNTCRRLGLIDYNGSNQSSPLPVERRPARKARNIKLGNSEQTGALLGLHRQR
jgi:Crp-like helix-turn-helix domain